MRRLALFLLLTEALLPVLAARRVTVDQLERALAAEHSKPDSKVAERLRSFELDERLSAAKLSPLEAAMPGPESRRALVVLADLSAFLDPPAAEIPAAAAPDVPEQRRIMALAVDYAAKTTHQFPNFTATRDTIHFEDAPARLVDTGRDLGGSFLPYEPLHPVSRSNTTVLYRDGQELMEADVAKKTDTATPGLVTSGEFGPILSTVLIDAAQGKLNWSHWERGATGPVAVFGFEVAKDKSHYQVSFCCVLSGNGGHLFDEFSGYHGEIAIDPAQGAILRLSLIANLDKGDPIVRSDIVVEYGPVDIGGKSYICPVKSISVSRAPAQAVRVSGSERPGSTFAKELDEKAAPPLQTMLNEVAFEQYHVFRSEVRMLTEKEAGAATSPPVSEAADAHSAASPAAPAESKEIVPEASNAATPAAENLPSSADAAPAVATEVAAPAEAPAAPEMSTAETSSLPDVPSTAQRFTLRMTTRQVSVSIVALDRKGRPVMDLKPEDFEVYDNGRKQVVQFFSAPGAPIPTRAGTNAGPTSDLSDEPMISNHGADSAGAQAGVGTANGRTTILLIDPGNLAWTDLIHAREQMLKFLRAIPAGDRAGLYAITPRGFQIVTEATIDHASLESALTGWTPAAPEIARAQQGGQRDRGPDDDVLRQSDLASAREDDAAASGLTQAAANLNPREQGGNPTRAALSVLVGVARHLAAIPGHKNLVWITGDPVFSDEPGAAGSGKVSAHVSELILRAHEALNDAQVSVYPLDASHLETATADSGLEDTGVELPAGVTAPSTSQPAGAPPEHAHTQAQQEAQPVQNSIQEIARATGGRVFSRSGDLAVSLAAVVQDSRATYLLGFTPDTPADDQYHVLSARLATRREATLRYRAGYFYAKDLPTLKDRFRQAIWQPLDASEIDLTARPQPASGGAALKLSIAATDLDLRQEGGLWADKLDIFVVHRDDAGMSAHVTGQTLALHLKPATYARLQRDGIPFDQYIAKDENAGSVRILVVDENSGRMGSVTFPASLLGSKE